MAEPFRCPLCGGTACEHRLTLNDRIARTTAREFHLVRCTCCGLFRLHPPPDEATLEAAYPDDYAPFERPGLSGRAKRLLERSEVRAIWDYLRPPRRILDVGCAGGELLAAIREAGNPEVAGAEPDAYAASLARSRGIEVHAGYLEDAGFPGRSFSTVLLDHVIEHVAEPLDFMREVNRLLIPGGAVVVWLPNADSLAARQLGAYWMGYDAPRHLSTFTLATISHLLAESGFRTVRIHHEWTGVEWAWGLRLRVRERWPFLDPLLSRLHTATILIATPLGVWAAFTRRSGRIRVIAVKARSL